MRWPTFRLNFGSRAAAPHLRARWLKGLLLTIILVMSVGTVTATAVPGRSDQRGSRRGPPHAPSLLARPEIIEMRWVDPPVKVRQEDCHEPSCGGDEPLMIEARDHDGVITAVDVWTVDKHTGSGWAVHADLVCPALTKPGTRVRVTIPAVFDSPGSYAVRAQAHSQPACGGLPHDTEQSSDFRHLDTEVQSDGETTP